MGSNHLYVFYNPKNPEPEDPNNPPPAEIDFEFAQKELAEHSGFSTEGLTAEQARVQEQVLEMLPMISEVNAVSEELNKYRHFELILLGAATQDDNETKVHGSKNSPENSPPTRCWLFINSSNTPIHIMG